MNKSGDLIVISGPSGVGKSTLVSKVRETMPELEFSVSCTTRSPRVGEEHGKSYYFLTHEEFEEKSKNDEFLEQAQVFANRYGTLKSEVINRIKEGRRTILDIDLQGALQIREAMKKDPLLAKVTSFIMIVPPSLALLEERLRNRGTESCEQLSLRIAAARNELSGFRTYDYLVVNDDLTLAANDLTSVLKVISMKTQLLLEDPF
jgi:guanylate kinase